MKYEKPEVTLLGTAASAIQILVKVSSGTQDSQTPTYFTTNAYEADE